MTTSSLVSVRGHSPKVGEDCFIAPSAQLIGQVSVGARCSIWYNVVLRGDVEPIVVGDETNIQDGSIVHGTFQKCGTTLGRRVTVGHGVILHGTTVGDSCLIGMGAILMDLSRIGARSLVGAGSLVTEGSTFPEGSLILGRPARVVRALTADELERLEKSADHYLLYKSWYEEKE